MIFNPIIVKSDNDNTCCTSTWLDFGNKAEGWIYPNGDIDWFALPTDKRWMSLVSVYSSTGDFRPIDIDIYRDCDFTWCTPNNNLGKCSFTQPYQKCSFSAEDDVYYLKVSGSYSSGSIKYAYQPEYECQEDQCYSQYWDECHWNGNVCCDGDTFPGQWYCQDDNSWKGCTNTNHNVCEESDNGWYTCQKGYYESNWRWRHCSSCYSDCQYPDLYMVDAWLDPPPAKIDPDSDTKIYFKIKNLNDADSDHSYINVGYYFDGVFQTALQIGYLKALEEKTFSLSDRIGRGDHTIELIADYDLRIKESNEDNNGIALSFTVPYQCTSGPCCNTSKEEFKPAGSQPKSYVDDTNGLCSGSPDSETTCTNGPTSTCYVLTRDYYCNGVDANSHVSYKTEDNCGTCKYCSENDLTCNNYDSSAVCGNKDCDYLDTTCRDYHDTDMYCSSGGCVLPDCNSYTNAPKGTSCGTGKECDGNGNCVTPNQCAGTDSSCGIYPNCLNCNSNDDCNGDYYRDYYCLSNNDGCDYNSDNCNDCSCSCGGYKIEESIANGNCNDGKDNDCNGFMDQNDNKCKTNQTTNNLTIYHCDECTGKLVRDQNNQYIGKWNDTPQWQSDIKVEGACSIGPFSDDNFVTLPPELIGDSGEGYIDFWVYFNKFHSNKASTIFSWLQENGSLGYFSQGYQNKLNFYLDGEALITATYVVKEKKWHHIIFSWNGTRRKIYIDDSLTLDNESQKTFPQIGEFRIGTLISETYKGQFLNGSIDEIKVYSVPAPIKRFNISLTKGWNLISFPLQLKEKTIKNIFKNINFKSIFSKELYYFNETYKNFNAINESKGYWVNSLKNQTLTIRGKEFESSNLSLSNGWNLISYPRPNETDINISYLKNYTVATYINNSWLSYGPNKISLMNRLKKLIPGYGYWVKK